MKRIVFTGVLCFLVSLSFGQKKAVTAAKNELKNNPPNFAEARNLIKEALTNSETANEAETWYVAGQIENRQFDTERALQILGKQPNEEVMYSALEKIIPYFTKAAKLDLLPDAKGKVKPKFLKDIRSNMKANRPFYINAGIFAFDKKNYKLAYESFKEYGDIPSMDIFKDEKWDIAKGDTTELQIRYYAGLAASLIPDPQATLAMFNDIINQGYVENSGFSESTIYQYVSQAYNQLGDSVNFEKTIKEGFMKFPSEEYYVLNLINLSINSGKLSESIAYLDKAIAQNPDNPQLYDVMGQVYEQDKKSEEAIKYMQKAVDMDPNNVDFLSHIGRVYFNLGVEKRTVADEISDVNRSKELTNQSKEYFRQSMPFFERIFEQDATNSGAIYALRSIYYNLGMNDKYNKMDALYSKDDDK